MPAPALEAPIDGHPHAGLPREVVDLHMAADAMGGYPHADPARQAELWDALNQAHWAVSDRPLTIREWLISTWWDLRARLYWAIHRAN
jgi:hypothetical protein